jgi:hypothetical protein
MRLIFIFIWIIVGALILWFFLVNLGQNVSIDFGKVKYENVELVEVIFLSFFVGLIVGAIIISSLVVKTKSEVRALKREQNKLIKELDGLRNMSIDELPEAGTHSDSSADID